MHYYKRNIGDYHKKAGRLSMLEHGAYTLLIDACYDREQFPTKQQAIDWCWAKTADEVAAVEFVLSKFFTEIDGQYVQGRIAEELAHYHNNSLQNQRIAKQREEMRRQKKATEKHEACTDEHEACTERHLTINHKPLTIKQKNNTPITIIPFDDFWNIYPRKTDKQKAIKAWAKVNPSIELFEQIKNNIQTVQVFKDPQYIPHATTYLNNKRWEDIEPMAEGQAIVQPIKNAPTDYAKMLGAGND